MRIGPIFLRSPRFGEFASFCLSAIIVLLVFIGIASSIEDGELTHEPELLRGLVFWGFSLAICLRVCWMVGFKENTLKGRIFLFVIAYIPVGLLSAYTIRIIQ